MTTIAMNFENWFQQQNPSVSQSKGIQAVLELSSEGATVPFMARYRKEKTGNLDEVAIQKILDSKERWDQLIQRQEYIVGEIEKQKKLTPELKDKILSTYTLSVLEDLYLPYKQKRKTKATQAREAGIEPLADWIWNCGHGIETPQPGQTLEIWAFTFRNEKAGYSEVSAVIEAAQDLLIERLSEMQDLRQSVRTAVFEKGVIRTSKGEKAKEGSKYEHYFSYSEAIQSLLQPKNSHRYLAIRRGWMEEELTLSIGGADADPEFEARLLSEFERRACTVLDAPGANILLKSARLAYKAYVFPSIENEVHKQLKEFSDEASIHVFSENVRKLLMASPFGAKAVLGVDPGIRTGCKLAVIDESGKYLASSVIHLQSEAEKDVAKKLLVQVVQNAPIQAIAVGNGTAGRETEIFIRSIFKEAGITVPVVMVSEAGASVYSASEVAREEFPDLDVTVRGAISIARRLQDPLAELVKIDPKSIGVGQYQHDVSQPALKRSLEFVVDSCVNTVGVNLNTASEHLLSHVSGIGSALAKSIVSYRQKNGLFKSRKELLEIPRFSSKAFEQGAGFLRIPDAEIPLDNTGVHPERYEILERVATRLGKTTADLLGAGVSEVKKDATLKEELGPYTFEDIIRELEKPGRDPREEFIPFSFREDIHEIKDLQVGMICPGIVTNVTNFGAFVDIGVHQDGLVHLSQLSDRFVKEAHEVVNPGDRVQVKVLEVHLDKKQIALTMKGIGKGHGKSRMTDRSRERTRDRTREAEADTISRRPEGSEVQRRFDAKRHNTQPRDHSRASVKSSSRSKPHGQPSRPSKPPRPSFTNNPFAALAGLKIPSKKDG